MQNKHFFCIADLTTEAVVFDVSTVRSGNIGLKIAFYGRLNERQALASRLGLSGVLPTDIDLLALAYQRWDLAMPEHLIGDFSFVIEDCSKQRVFGARDALGVHGLFYVRKATQLIVSARVAPLLDHPLVGRRLNHRKLAQSAVILADTSNESFYEGVLSLDGGSAFCLEAGGFKTWSYWQSDPERGLDIPDHEVPEALRALLFDAVGARLPTSSTPAALLSGGLDSSSLVAVAASILKQQNRRLLTISAVLPPHLRGKLVDESAFIRAFSDVDNIDFLDITNEQRGPFDDIDQTLRQHAVPHLGSRHYQYAAFSEAARANGAQTIFDGCFGELGPTHYGNGFYAELFRSGQWLLLAKEVRARANAYRFPVSKVIKSELLKPLAPAFLLKLTGREHRFDLALSSANQPFQHAYLARHLQQSTDEMLTRSNALVQDDRNPRAAHARSIAHVQHSQRPSGNNTNGTQFVFPFLDKRVVEFCLAAPTHLKVRNGYPRSLVRLALDGLLPPSIQWRTSKEPFAPDFHLRYNQQRVIAEELFASIGTNDPVREVVDVARLQMMVKHEMKTNRCDTPADFIAMHMVPKGVYLIHFLRQFSEFAPT
ncbi:asparagine synthase-related protein [Undibacterium sp. SXout11W]|uniref:asparagine synthase-related protein n=1 Tax=Undibacterium sp. SXout11W TaxID=3413050 RepID=UPI003BF14A49